MSNMDSQLEKLKQLIDNDDLSSIKRINDIEYLISVNYNEINLFLYSCAKEKAKIVEFFDSVNCYMHESCDIKGNTAILLSAAQNDNNAIEIIDLFVSRYSKNELQQRNSTNMSILHLCCVNNWFNVIRHLIETYSNCIDLNDSSNDFQMSPIELALYFNCFETFQILIDNHVKLSNDFENKIKDNKKYMNYYQHHYQKDNTPELDKNTQKHSDIDVDKHTNNPQIENDKLNAEIKKLKDQIEVYEKLISKQQKTIDDLTKNNSCSSQNQKKNINSPRNQSNNSSSPQNQKKSSNSPRNQNNNNGSPRIQRNISNNDANQALIENLQKQIKNLENQLQNEKNNVENLKNQIAREKQSSSSNANLKNQIDQLKIELQNQEKEMQQYKSRNESLEQENGCLLVEQEKADKKHTAEIILLRREIANLKKQPKSSPSKPTDINYKILALKRELDVKDAALKRLMRDNKLPRDFDNFIKEHIDGYIELQKENIRLKQQISNIESSSSQNQIQETSESPDFYAIDPTSLQQRQSVTKQAKAPTSLQQRQSVTKQAKAPTSLKQRQSVTKQAKAPNSPRRNSETRTLSVPKQQAKTSKPAIIRA